MRNIEVPVCSNHQDSVTFKSKWLDVRSCAVLHLHFSIAATGTPVGAITIEESNDPQIARTMLGTSPQGDSTADSVAKVDISADSARVKINGTGLAVNGANSTIVKISDPASYIRFVYTVTSGGSASTGFTCWALGKDT
jgi:uncharacterized Zn-binding protein involved in type VI secretion